MSERIGGRRRRNIGLTRLRDRRGSRLRRSGRHRAFKHRTTAEFRAADQQSHDRREGRIGHLFLRRFGDARLRKRNTHVQSRHTAEQFVEVFQFRGAARQHDAVGEFPREARILDLLLYEFHDVRGPGLDHRREVPQQDVLRFARRASVHADQFVIGRQLGHRRTVFLFQALDVFLRDAHRPDIAVDRRGAHRNRGDVAHHVPVIDRHVGQSGADVHHRYALLLLVGQKYRLGGRHRVRYDAQHPDAQAFQRHVETLHRRLLAQDEVERRRKFLAERPHRVAHLLIVVDHIVLRNPLHDRLVVRGLHVPHPVEERIDVLLVHAVLGVVDENMVRMAGAAHEVARNARIGLRNPDARLLLGSRHGRTDRLADQFDILDPARMNPLLDGFRDDANHVK